MGMNRVIEVYEEMAVEQAKHIREYFAGGEDLPDKERVEKLNKCDRALKVVGNYSRMLASRANSAAVALASAKMLALDREGAAIVWNQITGTDASTLVPAKSQPALEPQLRSEATENKEAAAVTKTKTGKGALAKPGEEASATRTCDCS